MMYEELIRDFAFRTRKNLVAVEKLREQGGDVFEVTQLVNSMLGLLIFPQQEYVDSIPKTSLKELERDGWPIPRVMGSFKQVNDLNQLIRYLRNAVAHFNIQFLGDKENQIRLLRVWNMTPVRNNGKIVRGKNGRTVEKKNWEAELSFSDLHGIANRFIDLLLNSSNTHNSVINSDA